MSAVEALEATRAAGIDIGIDGDDLVIESSAPPPPAVLDALSRHKAGIVALLRPANDGWTSEDWQVFVEERAGVRRRAAALGSRGAPLRLLRGGMAEPQSRSLAAWVLSRSCT